MRARALVVSVLLAAASGCDVPSIAVSAIELGVLPQSASIQGRDGGPSGLAWGHSVWTFGDTVLTIEDAEGSTWHHNSYSVTDDLFAADGIASFEERLDSVGAPRYFLAPTADEAEFNAQHRGDPCAVEPCGARWAVWPGPPIWDDVAQRALVFYSLIYAEPGDFHFESVGSSIAVWSDFTAEPDRPEVAPGTEHPTLLFGLGDPSLGTAALIDDGMLYAFACESSSPLAPPCSLGRAPPDRALDRAAWRFWDGASWSESFADRQPLFSAAPSVSVAWNAHLGAWAAVYAQPLSNDVVIRTAPALTGPWSDARLLFAANKEPAGAYDANWHPELDEEDGRILYVTFSRSNGVGWFGSEFALVRVELR